MSDTIKYEIDKEAVILVQMQPPARQSGEQLTSSQSEIAAKVAEKSVEAMNHAMSSIYHMIHRLRDMMEQINVVDRPAQVEMEFGLMVNGELGNSWLAKAGAEAEIKVKMTWQRKDETDAKS